ncbi:MAG: transposase [Candidatus Nitrosopolaris sp.]
MQGAGVVTHHSFRREEHLNILFMPKGLKRYYGTGDLHFITCSCHRRLPWLNTAQRRDLFLKCLEEVRQQHRFVVLGYVVMPEHFHLLMSEPQLGDPSTAMQSVKQRFAQRVMPRRRRRIPTRQPQPMPVWQPRFYDFNVWTERKRIEKLRYMHRNPVKRGLVTEPEQWLWSSFRYYKYREIGLVGVNDCAIMRMRVREAAA